MGELLFIIGVIGLFIAFIASIQFPVIPTTIYTIVTAFFDYMSNAIGIVWVFAPKDLSVTLLELVITIEIVIRAIQIFIWIYEKIRG